MNIKLNSKQLKHYQRWLTRQKYLTQQQFEYFSSILNSNVITIDKSEYDKVLELCPFGFVITPTEKALKLS